MRVKEAFLISILLILISCRDKEEDRESVSNFILDDLEREISIVDRPEKIVSLAPNLTEMIYLLGDGERLIGNTTYCNFPEEA